MNKYVIIVAGGKGIRMGGSLPKQFIPLNGKPILMHTLETFHRWDSYARLILVLPTKQKSYWKMLCRELGCNIPHDIADGGTTRFYSVYNGLKFILSLPEFSENLESDALIGIHDGVRPFVSPDVIDNCFSEAEKDGAAIPAMAMTESLRERLNDGSNRPVDRTHFFTVQTPQVFRTSILLEAYKQPYTPFFTDDASVVESIGKHIVMVEGNRENIKLTTPVDLEIAKAILNDTRGSFHHSSF